MTMLWAIQYEYVLSFDIGYQTQRVFFQYAVIFLFGHLFTGQHEMSAHTVLFLMDNMMEKTLFCKSYTLQNSECIALD